MLDSLKDLYVSYPFLYQGEPPAWMQHIKDVRCIAVFGAVDSIPQYKNSKKVWATLRIELNEESQPIATATVYCTELSETGVEVHLDIKNWEAGVPTSGNYMLVDAEFVYNAEMSEEHALHPDTIIVMQEAPTLYIRSGSMQTETDSTICFRNGNNVAASNVQDVVLLFGAVAAGNGVYTSDVIGALDDSQQGLGARSINGLSDKVWLKGSYPVKVERSNPGTYDDVSITIVTDELIQNETN